MCGVCTPGVQMLTILPQTATVADGLPPYPAGGFTHDIPDPTPFNFADETKKYSSPTDATTDGAYRLPDLVAIGRVWWPLALLVVLVVFAAKKGR